MVPIASLCEGDDLSFWYLLLTLPVNIIILPQTEWSRRD